MAPGAGGGGGGAIGANARGGSGGHSGRIFEDGIIVDPSAFARLRRGFSKDAFDIPYSAGGAGEGAFGDNSVGGRSGDGGDMHFIQGQLPAGSFRVHIGRGSRLPGEFGQPSYLEKLDEDGNFRSFGEIAQGGMSGDSYLPDGVVAVDSEYLERGFSVNCLALHNGAKMDGGLPTVKQIGGSWIDVPKFPFDLVVNVLVLLTVTAPFEKRVGIFVSLMHESSERSRIALEVPRPEAASSCVSCSFPIGAETQGTGAWRLVAHSNGILLNETWFQVRET